MLNLLMRARYLFDFFSIFLPYSAFSSWLVKNKKGEGPFPPSSSFPRPFVPDNLQGPTSPRELVWLII